MPSQKIDVTSRLDMIFLWTHFILVLFTFCTDGTRLKESEPYECITGLQQSEGFWEQSADGELQWNSNHCRSEVPDVTIHRDQKLTVVLLGDSVDRYWFHAACRDHPLSPMYNFTDGCHVFQPEEEDGVLDNGYPVDCLRQCTLPGAHFIFVHLPGVSLDQPFWADVEYNYVERIERALGLLGGLSSTIDVVVAGSLFWDLGRLALIEPPEIFEQYLLPRYILQSYQQNLTSMLQFFERSFPSQQLVFHTTRAARTSCDCDRAAEEALGRSAFTAQLNAIARKVVRKQNWLLLDFAGQLGSLNSDLALTDGHHLQNWFLRYMVEVVMCIAAPQECVAQDYVNNKQLQHTRMKVSLASNVPA